MTHGTNIFAEIVNASSSLGRKVDVKQEHHGCLQFRRHGEHVLGL